MIATNVITNAIITIKVIILSNSRHSASVLQNTKIKPKPLISTNQHTPLVCQCLYFSSFMWNKVNWLFNKYVSLTFMSRLDEQDIIGNIGNIINLIHWYLSCMRYALLAPHASDFWVHDCNCMVFSLHFITFISFRLHGTGKTVWSMRKFVRPS